jgi:hypothetical protein
MIANNIFRAIGDFFTDILFYPFEALRFIDNWWLQTTVSWIFIAISFVALFYWLGELRKYKQSGEE